MATKSEKSNSSSADPEQQALFLGGGIFFAGILVAAALFITGIAPSLGSAAEKEPSWGNETVFIATAKETSELYNQNEPIRPTVPKMTATATREIPPTYFATQAGNANKTMLSGARPSKDPTSGTPVPSPTPSPTPRPTFVVSGQDTSVLYPLQIQPGEKWIDVNLTSQTLVAYEGAAPVFESLVSSGLPRYPTVEGQFRIYLRFESQTMDGRRLGYDYYLKGVPYVQYFFEDYALHGTYWHNRFGQPMSHGCVNLPTPAAEWLFEWANHGTLVNIHR